MQIFEGFRPVFLIQSGVLSLGLWMLVDKYGMDVVAMSAGGLGFLITGAFAISYLTNVLEKKEKTDGEAEPVCSGPKPTPNDAKFGKLALGSRMVTPECVGELKQSCFGTLGGDEKGYRFGNRESTRACERGFDDFNESEAPTSTRDDVKQNFTRAEVNPMITRDNEKHANTMFQPKGNVYDGYTSRESTTSVYGVKERIMSKKRCYISKSRRDACSTKVDDTPQLLDFGIPLRKELNGPEVAQSERLVDNEEPAMYDKIPSTTHGLRRTEFRHEGIHDHAVSSANLRNTLLVFLDDDCMAMFDYCTPITPMGMTDLFQHMKSIFGKTEPVNNDAKGIFYTQVQKPNEVVRAFFTSLWKLAKNAFKTDATVFNVDSMVKERFINGLNDPYLIMQLTSNKMFTKTSFEALEATLELVNRLESWKTNSQVVMSPMTQRKQVGFHDELLTKAHEAPVSEDMRVCFICRKPGHKAAYCRENRNPSAPTSQPRTITNAVINNVMMNDSIIGKCFVNGNPVHFLFDNGTVKTIIADRNWRQCKKVDSKLIPIKSTIETCIGGPIEVIGTGKCELQLHNFKGEVEVIVVKKLIYDCLLGLDMAFKLSDIKEYLDKIKAALRGKTLEVKKKAKTPLKATLPEIYISQASVNATNFKELPLANGDPEEPVQDEDKKKKVEAYLMILHDEFEEIVAQGLQGLTQTNEVEVNEAQLEDESVGILFKWLTSGEKPVKCSKDGPDLYIYWCNFRDFRIFGKNVYRCYDKFECGVHFQYVVPTDDQPKVLINYIVTQ
ncbi:hypothetical protein BpHYR1_020967 [Brachionus plicatilis]|uniref:CCHC-type domain-containing protein n=1 Tax=Brachionus plicatilis TaxID=10195 RepID=A0A3M7SG44_BRAPC|nr:hypothetical protein BpHYR1_020967 [Brachionus plicatilis]